jgi:hypothetical protein
MAARDVLVPTPIRPRHGRDQVVEDLRHLAAGRLDRRSLLSGYRRQLNPVEVRTTSLVPDGVRLTPSELVRDPAAFSEHGAVWDPLDRVWRDTNFGMQRRAWREIRRTNNTRLNVGRDQVQRIGTFGDVGTGTGLSGAVGNATATSATTMTDSGATFPTGTSSAGNAGLQGHVVYVGKNNSGTGSTVLGIILSNTGTVLTVDQWYALPLTGAAGTTPNATGNYFIVPGSSWPWWVALSTSSAAAAATDVTRSSDGLWGDGTSGGTATEQTANGLARAYCGQGGGTAPTIPGAGQIQFNHTWTYSGSSLVTIPKVVLFNSLAAAGTIPMLETLLNAQATVNTNGDTIQLAGWQITF